MQGKKKFTVPEKMAYTGPVKDDVEAYATALQAQAELQEDIADSLDGINTSLFIIAKCFRRTAEQTGALTPEDVESFDKLDDRGEEENEGTSN